MQDLETLKRVNDEAAERELKNLRAYTVRGLKHAMFEGGIPSVLELLRDADIKGVVREYFQRRN